ncbi:FecR family protein [Dyadobacter aurulentus]|uniref:FecR family protein n=1 Tax=Dyadobacter sp. UC 10 TaxID=2605428 RepID=UPI0011F122D8|nr:FecR domain-containing protein [Dyadobacter sp. UC 10]KAA0992314.1 DUF4974 domain-containing protein [Dyadobacter sp. UC 10]
MEFIITKEIMFNYFSGHASALQKKMIAESLADPKNLEIYYAYLEEWEKCQPQFLPDLPAAFSKNLKRIHSTERQPRRLRKDAAIRPLHALTSLVAVKVAACLFVLGLTGYFFRDHILYENYETAYGELRSFTLSDSSSVVLNSNSTLRVPRFTFAVWSREVRLAGEAEFHVRRRDDKLRFVVHTPGNNTVTVLGTEFSVYSRNNKTDVTLNKGKVELASVNSLEPTVMKPGEKGSFAPDGSIYIQALSPGELSSQTAWKEQRFAFNHTTLTEIAVQIRDVFGTDIRIDDPSLASRQLTGTFKAQTADDLLEVLKEMLGIEVIKVKKQVHLIPKPTNTN